MKKVVIASLCFFSFIAGCMSYAATVERSNELESIKEFPGISKDQIHSRSYSWIARNYNSANNVVQLNDKESGQIIVQAMGSVFDLVCDRHFRYTMVIDIKEGKMRVQFDNITSERIGPVAGPDMNYQWDKVKKHLDSLKEELFLAVAETTKEDW